MKKSKWQFFRDAGVGGRVHEVPQAQPPAPHLGCYHVYSVERKLNDFIINIPLSNFFLNNEKKEIIYQQKLSKLDYIVYVCDENSK